jgi:hypothetical protein
MNKTIEGVIAEPLPGEEGLELGGREGNVEARGQHTAHLKRCGGVYYRERVLRDLDGGI